TLIRAGSDATELASGPPDSVRNALTTAKPGNAGAAIKEALALASTELERTPERRGQIVVATDGALSDLDTAGPLAAPVEIATIGGGTENQAVSDVEVRMDPSGRAQTAFVEVTNEADHAVRVPLRLTADDAPL